MRDEFLYLDKSPLDNYIHQLGARILIVIEKEVNLKAIQAMLTSMGVKSDMATSDE